MRCYFLRGGKIMAVEFLAKGSDADLISQSDALFKDRADKAYEGYEVWDGGRFVYRFPQGDSAAPPE